MSLAASIARRMLGKERPREVSKGTSKVPPTSRPGARAATPTTPRPSPPIELPPPAAPELPPAQPALRPGWKGSCKAVNLSTGRQCALLHGHEGLHRHGSTAFATVALSDADVARARSRLDTFAQSRPVNPQSAW